MERQYPYVAMARSMHTLIQSRWRDGYVIGYDCVAFGDGRVTIADTYSLYDPNTGVTERLWMPLCDTTLEGMTKHNDDIWTEVDIFHGAFEFEEQKFVFGDGGMGNEGYVASISADNALNWSLFSTFSNPIMKAEIIGRQLVCYGETGAVLHIDVDNPVSVSVSIIR